MIKKPTENEIIKALECCIGQTEESNACVVCPFNNTDNCMRCEEFALDLINRQNVRISEQDKIFELLKAEREEFKIELQAMRNAANGFKAENERLRNAYKQCAWKRDIFAEDMNEEIKKDCSYLMLDIKTIKAEAYKECTEKLKSIFGEWIYDYRTDNLFKEKVGEDKQ